MRKLSVPVTIAIVLCMLFTAGLPSVLAQDTPDCSLAAGSGSIVDFYVNGEVFAQVGQNQVVYISSPSFPNKTVVVLLFDINTGELISETIETLPVTLSTANEQNYYGIVYTEDFTIIDWYIVITCGEELLSCPIDDGRLDTTDCGALVAAYPNGTVLDIYGIDPASGEGVLVFSFDLATAGDVTENTLLAEGTNPFNGQPIRLYKLAGGGYQLNSTQPNGEPYEFAWS
jgi:hypothetical protein